MDSVDKIIVERNVERNNVERNKESYEVFLC